MVFMSRKSDSVKLRVEANGELDNVPHFRKRSDIEYRVLWLLIIWEKGINHNSYCSISIKFETCNKIRRNLPGDTLAGIGSSM